MAEQVNTISVENLSFGYTAGQVVLRDLSFGVKRGKFLAVAGPNGAGKSTLLNLACNLLHPRRGSISIDNRPVSDYSVTELARKIAVVRQEFVPAFSFSVYETVLIARTLYMTGGRFPGATFESENDRKVVTESLVATETAEFTGRSLSQLSGGERQRVFIARALAQETPILLLDEPTSFLDLKHQVRIYDLLKQWQLEKGTTIVIVTHDVNLAGQYCDEILLLGPGGSYLKGRPEEALGSSQIESVFGVRGFSGAVGEGRFFLPLGRLAKDFDQIDRTKQTDPRNGEEKSSDIN